ncbi:MAG TPA: poly-gamma-glutamate synthase PgsB [Phycisphaerae bacterium]|nr:poly-gamma-glutamate synthase PgsB [Phycisphaerae bacterium]
MTWVLLALTVGLLGFLTAEYAWHVRCREAVGLRIHVNGTRGKSSVCRLIGAGLRAAGRRTLVKTTGSAARLIFEDGTEHRVARPGPPRVLEQLRMFRVAARRRAEAMVVECMALQPYLQYLSERQIVRAHVAVITNVRADHLDVMGPDVDGVAMALAGVVPSGGTLVTRQSPYDAFFRKACAEQGCTLRLVDDEEVARVGPEELGRFGHIEHAENVAVALAACEAAGAERGVALEGMYAAEPDLGALRVFRGHAPGGEWTFADGFAANDPQSSAMLWQMLTERYPGRTRRLLVVNCRADRLDRSRQLGEMMAAAVRADRYVLVGAETRMARRPAEAGGIPAEKLLDMAGASAEAVFEELIGAVEGPALIVGMGNIKGIGEELSARFRQASS